MLGMGGGGDLRWRTVVGVMGGGDGCCRRGGGGGGALRCWDSFARWERVVTVGGRVANGVIAAMSDVSV